MLGGSSLWGPSISNTGSNAGARRRAVSAGGGQDAAGDAGAAVCRAQRDTLAHTALRHWLTVSLSDGQVSDGTRLVTHKRQFIVYNETLAHTVLRHWLEYVDGNETLIYHFPRSLFELLPLEEPQWHFKTCAVVGNSGVVLLRENGAEIDAHDVSELTTHQ
eukprot:8561233-Pyramimonas_sp.AAC.1